MAMLAGAINIHARRPLVAGKGREMAFVVVEMMPDQWIVVF